MSLIHKLNHSEKSDSIALKSYVNRNFHNGNISSAISVLSQVLIIQASFIYRVRNMLYRVEEISEIVTYNAILSFELSFSRSPDGVYAFFIKNYICTTFNT